MPFFNRDRGIPKPDSRGFIRVVVEVTPQLYKEKLETGIGWRGLVVRGIESMRDPMNVKTKNEYERRMSVLQAKISELGGRLYRIESEKGVNE